MTYPRKGSIAPAQHPFRYCGGFIEDILLRHERERQEWAEVMGKPLALETHPAEPRMLEQWAQVQQLQGQVLFLQKKLYEMEQKKRARRQNIVGL